MDKLMVPYGPLTCILVYNAKERTTMFEEMSRYGPTHGPLYGPLTSKLV